MATGGWENVKLSDFKRRIGGSGPEAARDVPATVEPKRGSKFKAERCIVLNANTLITETEIHALAAARGTLEATAKRMTLVELAATLDIVGQLFASMKEARRYIALAQLQAAGVISELETQPAYPLHIARPRIVCGDGTVDGGYEAILVATYRADFRYKRDGVTVVEDTKSDPTRTTAYMLRKKMTEAEHRITIIEV